MLTVTLSGPPATHDALAEQFQAAGAVIDPNPAQPTGGLPPEDLAWIVCDVESLATIGEMVDAAGWALRLHRNAGHTIPATFTSNN
jgi:hypothetical protein